MNPNKELVKKRKSAYEESAKNEISKYVDCVNRALIAWSHGRNISDISCLATNPEVYRIDFCLPPHRCTPEFIESKCKPMGYSTVVSDSAVIVYSQELIDLRSAYKLATARLPITSQYRSAL